MPKSVSPRTPQGPLDPVAAQIAEFFKTDPVWQGLMKRPAAETRAMIKAALPPSTPREVEHVEDFRVHVSGGTIGLRLYRPVKKAPGIIVWAHGGGYTLGSVEESDGFCRELALKTGCAVASVDYRLAPEFPYPYPVNDLLSATLWVSDRRVALAGGSTQILLGGDSAGANLAAAVTRRLHETRVCPIAGNILAYPSTDTDDADSLEDFKPPFLTAKEVSWFFKQYLPTRAARKEHDVVLLRAPNLGIMPPTLIITAEHDIITAQAVAYGEKLRSLGVDVRFKNYPGMIHGFLTLEPFFAGAAGAALDEISVFAAEAIKRAR